MTAASTSPGLRQRIRWVISSVRLRLLSGLALLLVAGLVTSSVTSGVLLDRYLHQRFTGTLQQNAERISAVLAAGPQTANGVQFTTLLGPPLGLLAVGPAGQVLISTGSADIAPEALVRAVTAVPVGQIVNYDDHGPLDDLSAIAIPSLGLSISQDGVGRPLVRPTTLILTIDTSVDDATTADLIRRQAVIVAGALMVLLSLATVVTWVGLRPLNKMATTAGAIAAGSLSQRLPTRGNHSETDRLAFAVNDAFDAQARAEAVVRSFAADASHELKTPLSVILGWLDLHRQGALDAAGLETAVEHIDNEVGRMRLLVEELGLLAQLDAGRPIDRDEIDLVSLSASVVEDAQFIYSGRSINLTAHGESVVSGDAARLQQVLRNLVGNAVQHTPTNTAVTVALQPTERTVQMTVTDNGPGIAAEDLPRLFERFWRAEASRSRAYGGSGLGLAIVEAIVHAHHGTVAVDSTVGVGTVVTVTLPKTSASTAPVPSRPAVDAAHTF